MTKPIQITFRHMRSSPAVRKAICKRVTELERFYPGIVGCHVVFDQNHRRQQQGRLFQVRIELSVPDARLVVSHEAPGSHEHEDAYVAIRDAFDAARRQLEDFSRKQYGQVKHHEDERPAA